MKDFATFLTYSGISTILFLLLLLGRSWQKRVANKILAGILLGFLLLFLTYACSYLKLGPLSAIVSPIGILIPFALGPLIFQYIKTIYTSKIDTKGLLRGLLPFALAIVLCSIPQYVMGPPLEDKITIFRVLGILIPFLGVVYFAYYLFLGHKLLKRFRKAVKNNYASLGAFDLKWLSLWIRGFVLFLLIDMISGLLLTVYPIEAAVVYSNLFYLVLLIWYIGYYGVNQAQVFLVHENLHEYDEKANAREEINKSTYFFNCESEEFRLLKARLEKLFSEQRLFKRQHLSLKETADILKTSDKKLSYLLNICLDSNFYEYVNTYRVAYFRDRLEAGDAEKLTLLAIAFDSGFNSKATFNRVFKQQAGITPMAFKKQLSKASQSFH